MLVTPANSRIPETAPELAHPVADLALAVRLERTEALANRAFVQSRARLEPARNAAWMEAESAIGLFDGEGEGGGSPLTQSFCLGLGGSTVAALDALEAFYDARGCETFHEVSPVADAGLLTLLSERGYRPVELTTVLCRRIPSATGGAVEEGGIRVRQIGVDEADRWAATSAAGWLDVSPEIAAFAEGMGRVSARSEGTTCFLAEADGVPVASGSLFVSDGVALLAGASTVPEFRNRGAQRALLRARRREACRSASPSGRGSASPTRASSGTAPFPRPANGRPGPAPDRSGRASSGFVAARTGGALRLRAAEDHAARRYSHPGSAASTAAITRHRRVTYTIARCFSIASTI
jgi:hypothetical protein